MSGTHLGIICWFLDEWNQIYDLYLAKADSRCSLFYDAPVLRRELKNKQYNSRSKYMPSHECSGEHGAGIEYNMTKERG
jgi:hypothetical protein